MKTCLTQSRSICLFFSDEKVNLTLRPMTFGKLVDISSVLGDGKDLGEVLSNPNVYDLSLIAYCLFDDESKDIIDSATLNINDKEQITNPAHKLYYLMCDNNVETGLTNYTNILQTVSLIVQDSVSDNKKKILKRPILSTLKKFMIK